MQNGIVPVSSPGDGGDSLNYEKRKVGRDAVTSCCNIVWVYNGCCNGPSLDDEQLQ